jgi:hypothetical protein
MISLMARRVARLCTLVLLVNPAASSVVAIEFLRD